MIDYNLTSQNRKGVDIKKQKDTWKENEFGGWKLKMGLYNKAYIKIHSRWTEESYVNTKPQKFRKIYVLAWL